MRNVIEEVEKLLDKYAIEREEESYREYRYEGDKELNLEEELDNLLVQFPEIISDFSFIRVGGFDSPGYTIECAILIIVIEGKITSYSINFESY